MPAARRPAAALLFAAVAVCLAPPAASGALECDRTKQYRLNERQGPWMVMCATFRPGLNPEAKGLTPEQAADELVYELREKNIPAVAWVMDSKKQTLKTTGRDGEEKRKVMASVRGGVAVMAGNFGTLDDEKAQRALASIKKMQPKCLAPDPKKSRGWTGMTASGGRFRLTPGRKSGPLARAQLVTNPLMSPEEIARRTRRRDPVLVRLNGGREHSLSGCPGKYTLVIAQFHGKGVMQIAGTEAADLGRGDELTDSLDKAGRQAWELCQVLRNRDKVEAYVWHTKHRSIVTVGGFDDPRDPAAARLARTYAAAAPALGPAAAPQPRTITIPKDVTDFRKARRFWMLEATPMLMDVPEL